MLKSKERIQLEAQELIIKFKEEMHQLTGVTPVVIVSFSDDMMHPLPLEELENMINTCFNKFCPHSERYPNRIRTKTRKREIVIYRQLFCFLGKRMGYGPSALASYLDVIDHASAIHSQHAFAALLESRNEEVLLIFNSVYDAYQKRFEPQGVFQLDNSKGANPKSVLSPMLYAGIDKSKLNKPASGSPDSKGE